MSDKYIIGIDAGGTKVAYGLFDGGGNLVATAQHPSDINLDGAAFADVMLDNISTLLSENGVSTAALSGVGVCMPSFILYESGHVLLTSALPKIKDFPMKAYLQERIGAPIILDNDSNAAALAEYRYGAGKNSRHMVYIIIGTGFGSGIIIDGKVFHGSYGSAGECGHMIATPGSGMMCGCENAGCFMSYASGRFLPEHVKRLLEEGMKSELTYETANGINILAAYKNGDSLAVALVDQMANYIGLCAYNVYQVLNINTFVFGGGLSNFGSLLLDKAKAVFLQYDHAGLPVHFLPAELTENFGVIGAAEFVREVCG